MRKSMRVSQRGVTVKEGDRGIARENGGGGVLVLLNVFFFWSRSNRPCVSGYCNKLSKAVKKKRKNMEKEPAKEAKTIRVCLVSV
jgi:hypothetical protein